MFRTAYGFAVYPLVALSVMQVLLAVFVVHEPGWQAVVFRIIAVVLPSIAVLLMVTTNYRVIDGVLHLRMAFWRRRIPIETITSLSEYGITKGRVYGLGTDILAIEYEGGVCGRHTQGPGGIRRGGGCSAHTLRRRKGTVFELAQLVRPAGGRKAEEAGRLLYSPQTVRPVGMFHRQTLLAACAVCLAATVSAMQVGNFALTDQSGATHELFDAGNAKVVVLMLQGNGCPVVRNALIDLAAVRERFRGEPVRFLMINSNLQDDEVSIRAEAREWGIDLPVLVDDTQEVGEALGFTRTAEALVIDTQSRSLAYRGPINDRLVYERQRSEADNHYVIDAVEAVLAGEPPAVEAIAPVGCLINFPERGDRPAPRETHHH